MPIGGAKGAALAAHQGKRARKGRTLMVGDTTHDLQLAVNAGVACVGVSYGAHTGADFHRFKPLHVAHSPRELHDWLHLHG